MEIETTKLSKTAIETPNIKTSRLIAYDDIIIRNSSLGEIFGSVESTEEKIDARDLLNYGEGISSGYEQIHAFRCDISDYTYDRFKSITVRKAPNDWGTGATSQQKEVWMFVRCFDEYMNVVNVDKIISIKPVQQVSDETTWEFEPFILLPEYKILEFRITEDRENLNTNPDNYTNTIRSANIHNEKTKLYIKNWKTIDQVKYVDNFTTDCYFELLRKNTLFDGLMEGLNNNEMKIHNHINDVGDIHLTSEDREKINKIDGYIADTSNAISEVKEDIKSMGDNIEALSNSTVANYNLIEENTEKISEINGNIYDTISTFKKHSLNITEGLIKNPSSVSVQKNDIIEVQLQPLHPIEENAYLRQIIITEHTSSSNDEIYLVLYGSKENDENNFEYIGVSNNSQAQNKTNNDNGERMIFTFDENVNIGGYKKFRLFYARNNSSIHPEPISNLNNIIGGTSMSFNAYPLDKENVLNDNEFILWNSSGETTTGYAFPATFKYETIEGQNILHKENSISHLTKNERDILIIPEYDYSNVIENDILDALTVHGFELGKMHIKSGFIKEIKIPFGIGLMGKAEFHSLFCEKEVYLAVHIFKNGESPSTLKSMDETYFSENSILLNCDEIYDSTLNPDKSGDYIFTFNNLEIPDDFDFVRFMPTTSKNVLPNGFTIANCAKMRVRPIKRNDNWYNFDTDGCKVITGSRSTENASAGVSNYMPAAYFKYSPMAKQQSSRSILSHKWRLEAGNIDVTTAEDLYIELLNTHKASIHATVQNYYDFVYGNELDNGEISTEQKTNYIFDITYPNLMDAYEVTKTVRSNNYEKPNYPKIYPIFN